MNAFYAATILTLVAGQPQATERPSVLVLDDYRLVEGQVAEIPDFHDATGETKLYRLTSAGNVQTIPAKAVLFSGGTRQEAYRFVKGKWNPMSPDGHLKLAEWCRGVDLIPEALAEARAAVTPGKPDPYLAKLVRELEAVRAKAPEERTVRIVRPAPPPVVASAKALVPVTEMAVDPSAVDPALTKPFGLKIQPILMNQCVSCHSDPKKPSRFVLVRAPEGESLGPVTKKNLAAVLGQVNANNPVQSPLLAFAITPHGGQVQAALHTNHPAYRHVSEWVASAAATLPRPVEAVRPKPESAPGGPVATSSVAGSPAAINGKSAAPAKIQFTLGKDPADAFDPAEFNKAIPPVKKP